MEHVSVSRHNRKQVLKNLYGGLRNEKPKAPRFKIVFYVYSDLISPQIVGDAQTPLLRIVRTKGKDGETISQYYDRPQYLPLVRHSFQTIQSELRLNSGDFVPFERGSGLTHYKGINFQKGYGIGGIFRRLFSAALPFLVKGGKTIGKEVLMTGSHVASDVLSGENFKEAVKTRSRESGKKLAQKAIDRVQSMVGKGQYKRKPTDAGKMIKNVEFKMPNNEVLKETNLARLYDDMSEKIVKESEDFEGRDSGWTLDEILRLEVRTNRYSPFRGS
ncbi:uncharacterized protein TNCV_1465901 [Trichonephila clavipes]|nr:uncharacterized protein TNCV_1465901 [Trichonephila clavipes]